MSTNDFLNKYYGDPNRHKRYDTKGQYEYIKRLAEELVKINSQLAVEEIQRAEDKKIFEALDAATKPFDNVAPPLRYGVFKVNIVSTFIDRVLWVTASDINTAYQRAAYYQSSEINSFYQYIVEEVYV